MRTTHLALLLGAWLAGCAEAPPSAPLPGARMERVTREVMREFPEVERHFDAMSYDEAFRVGGDLAQRGLPRLDDRGIEDHTRRRHGLLASSDEACVALVGGNAREALRVLEAQPNDELRAFIRLSTRAQALELRGGPRPMTADEAARLLDEALDRIRAALPPSEASRWDTARSSSDPRDACFIERTALRELLRMPPADGVRYQRALLESTLAAL